MLEKLKEKWLRNRWRVRGFYGNKNIFHQKFQHIAFPFFPPALFFLNSFFHSHQIFFKLLKRKVTSFMFNSNSISFIRVMNEKFSSMNGKDKIQVQASKQANILKGRISRFEFSLPIFIHGSCLFSERRIKWMNLIMTT